MRGHQRAGVDGHARQVWPDESREHPRQAEAEQDIEDVGADGVRHRHVVLAVAGDEQRTDGVGNRGSRGEDRHAHDGRWMFQMQPGFEAHVTMK